jgi:dienelactone hydrolase
LTSEGDFKIFRAFHVVVVLVYVSGCASHAMLPADYVTPDPLPRSYLSQFCYRAGPIVDSLTLVKEKKSYRVFEASMEAGLDGFGDDSPITFEFYEQLGNTPSPVVLVLPILNGQKHLVRPFATYFARNGYAVVIVDTVQRRTLLEDLANPEPAIRQTIQRHRRVIDWVESRPDLDVSRLAVFGPSLGGFNALFLAAVDERVSVVSPALVGGSLAFVLVTSNERRIKEAVAGAKEKLSMNDEQLMQHLAKNIQTDTLTIAPHINADRVLMVLAKYDKSVPYESQLKLREAMGQPEAFAFPTGHATTAAYLFYLRSKIRKFFDRKLAEPSESGTALIPDDVCM